MGRDLSLAFIRDFRDILDNLKLIDLPCMGEKMLVYPILISFVISGV